MICIKDKSTKGIHQTHTEKELSTKGHEGRRRATKYIGGRAKNMHKRQRELLTGRGGVDKAPVVGIRDRATGRVRTATAI